MRDGQQDLPGVAGEPLPSLEMVISLNFTYIAANQTPGQGSSSKSLVLLHRSAPLFWEPHSGLDIASVWQGNWILCDDSSAAP